MTRNRYWVLLYDHTWDKQRRVYVDQAEDTTDASIQAEQSYPGYAVIACGYAGPSRTPAPR